MVNVEYGTLAETAAAVVAMFKSVAEHFGVDPDTSVALGGLNPVTIATPAIVVYALPELGKRRADNVPYMSGLNITVLCLPSAQTNDADALIEGLQMADKAYDAMLRSGFEPTDAAGILVGANSSDATAVSQTFRGWYKPETLPEEA